jgi:tetratricopeptide (TPR) repeat protein
LGDQHPSLAGDYNSLGGAWSYKGEYDKAIGYHEKALQINSRALGDQHPNLAGDYRSLGGAMVFKGDYEKAIVNYEKALQINVSGFWRPASQLWQEITTASVVHGLPKGNTTKRLSIMKKRYKST